MQTITINGVEAKIMREFNDPKYGLIKRIYMPDRKTYMINDELVENPDIIDELDNKYGVPVAMRTLV